MESPNNIKKVNRKLTCVLTGREITVKPDKFQRMVSYHGSEKKAIDNFVCYEVEKQSRDPELLFWVTNSTEFKDFKKHLLKHLKLFNDSKRTQEDALNMQKSVTELLNLFNIFKYDFITKVDERGGYVSALKVKSIPFLTNDVIIDYE